MPISSIIQDNINSLEYFIPELLLTGIIVLMIIADMLLKKQRSAWMSVIALIGAAAVTITVIQQYDLGSRLLFNNMLGLDPFSLFFKLLFLASAIIYTHLHSNI